MNETNLSPPMAMSTRAVSLAGRALQPRPRECRGAVNFEMEVDNARSLWLACAGNDGRATRNRPASWSASLQPIGRAAEQAEALVVALTGRAHPLSGARRRADRPRDNTGIRRDALMR